MGLGGYLTWTALAREVRERHGLQTIPVEIHGSTTRLIKSPIFYNNPDFIQSFENNPAGVQIVLNHPGSNYCIKDTPERAFHKSDRHIIESICEPYGITDPELRCEIFLDEKEKEDVLKITKDLPKDFVTIEPFSKTNYTPNRAYPFEKWQSVVNTISKKIPVIQIGNKTQTLENTINLTGMTTFRTAAGIIGKSKIFLATESGLVHSATAFNTKSVVVITGYQSSAMVAYPQNTNLVISQHGPCGLKIPCPLCKKDAAAHDEMEMVKIIERELCL